MSIDLVILVRIQHKKMFTEQEDRIQYLQERRQKTANQVWYTRVKESI